jgi:putative transposase
MRLGNQSPSNQEVTMKRRIAQKERKSKAAARVSAYAALVAGESDRGSRLSLIQALIPLGLLAVEEVLQAEVRSLAGEAYERGSACVRWGSNPGSVYLGDQKVSLRVPRVRRKADGQEQPLSSYQRLQVAQTFESQAFARVLRGLSCRQYEQAAQAVPETFGLSANTVSRHFIRASRRRLEELRERDLSGHDFVALILDGKTFAEHELLTALGVTAQGRKIFLGVTETATENHRVCAEFLRQLQARGLSLDKEILFVVDGAKGLSKGIREVFGGYGFVQRCQWHKRENVLAYLPKNEQPLWRRRLQRAYQKPLYAAAKKALCALEKELRQKNESAANSLQEGLEETLTLHRLGLARTLGTSLKTTNALESVHAQVERYTRRITRWKNSSQRQRWVASVLLEIEPRLRKIKGFRHLPKLRPAMKAQRLKRQQAQLAAA